MKVSYISMIALVSLLVSIMLQQNLIIKNFYYSPNKVAVPIQSDRTDQGDTYHYYIASKRTIATLFNKFTDATSSNTLNYINCSIDRVYYSALLMSGLINTICDHLTMSPRISVMLTLIVQTAITIFSFMFALLALLDKDNTPRWLGVFVLATLSALLLNAFAMGSYAGAWWFRYPLIKEYPDILRPVNPQMGWSFGLLYLCLFVEYLKSPSQRKFFSLILLSLLFGSFSVSLNITFLIALCFYFILKSAVDKKINYKLMFIGLMLVCSFLIVRYQLNHFQLTEKGNGLGTGHFLGFSFKFHYLLYLLLIPFLMKIEKDYNKYFFVSLLLASVLVGATCNSVQLGARLWLRGSVIYVWLFIFIIIANYLFPVFKKIKFHNYKIIKAAKVLLFFCATYLLLHINLSGWNGFIEKDKWEVLHWLNQYGKKNAIVISENIEDSFLISIYTHQYPLIELFDLNDLNIDEILKRYFYTIHFFGNEKQIFNAILRHNEEDYLRFFKKVAKRGNDLVPYSEYQTNAFYSILIYYPYVKPYDDILENELSKKKFNEAITALYQKSTQLSYPYDYVIVNKKENKNYKFSRNLLVFENQSYAILRR